MKYQKEVWKAKDLGLIKKIIQKELEDNVVSVILFGSAAKSFKKANDYDILVITKNYPKDDFSLAWKIKYQLLGKITKPIDLIFQEIKDLDYPSPLFYEARSGKLVYGKNLFNKIKENSESISPIIQRGVKIGWQIAQ